MSESNYGELLPYAFLLKEQEIAAQNSWLRQSIEPDKIPRVLNTILCAEAGGITWSELESGHVYLLQLRNGQSSSSNGSRLSDASSLSQGQARPYSGTTNTTDPSRYSGSSTTSRQPFEGGQGLSYPGNHGQDWCMPETQVEHQLASDTVPPSYSSFAPFPAPPPLPQDAQDRGRTQNADSRLPPSSGPVDGRQRSRSLVSFRGKNKALNPPTCFCFACGTKFTRTHGLVTHMEEYCEALRGQPEDMITCGFCSSTMKRIFYPGHVKDHFRERDKKDAKGAAYRDLRLKWHLKTNPTFENALSKAYRGAGQTLQHWSLHKWDVTQKLLNEIEHELVGLGTRTTVFDDQYLVSLCEALPATAGQLTSAMDWTNNP